MPNYLQQCLDEYPEFFQERYGARDINKQIEGACKKCMHKSSVAIKDVVKPFYKFKINEAPWFNKYWAWPAVDNLPIGKCNFAKDDEQYLIEELLKAFRNIELVSIILRFVYPRRFGIFAPPVAYLLAISSGKTAVETYCNYLASLRKIRNNDDYEMQDKKIADIQNALWVLFHKPDDNPAKKAFEADEFMTGLRADNMTFPLNSISPVRLAESLHRNENKYALVIACYALEHAAKRLSDERKIKLQVQEGLKKLLDVLKDESGLSFLYDYPLENFVKTRNSVMHGGEVGQPNRKPTIQKIIDCVWEMKNHLEAKNET